MALTPAIFFGHGSPVITLTANAFTNGWRAIGQSFVQKPKGIVCISAHWYTTATGVLVNSAPETIHDFGGAGPLFDIKYPAPGDPALARRVQKLLAPVPVQLSNEWGFDHGTWTVMRHVFPKADVPIIQLSIDAHLPPQFHYDLGQRLAPLREEGILIAGSGNVVHNLPRFVRQSGYGAFDWAQRFDTRVRSLLKASDHKALTQYSSLGPDALLAVPTPDHYLPLLYVLGSHAKADKVSFPVEGIDGGSMSMLTVRLS